MVAPVQVHGARAALLALGVALAAGCVSSPGGSAAKTAVLSPQVAAPAAAKGPAARWGGYKAEESRVAKIELMAVGIASLGEPDDDQEVARRFKRGDQVSILLGGIPTPQKIEDIIDHQGMVTMPFIGQVHFVGKTTVELETSIRDAYIERKIFRDLSITVVPPASTFFVKGEVQRPGPYPLRRGLTIEQAITTAGGPNKWAYEKKIYVYRDGKEIVYSAKSLSKLPEKERVVRDGDTIELKRSRL